MIVLHFEALRKAGWDVHPTKLGVDLIPPQFEMEAGPIIEAFRAQGFSQNEAENALEHACTLREWNILREVNER